MDLTYVVFIIKKVPFLTILNELSSQLLLSIVTLMVSVSIMSFSHYDMVVCFLCAVVVLHTIFRFSELIYLYAKMFMIVLNGRAEDCGMETLGDLMEAEDSFYEEVKKDFREELVTLREKHKALSLENLALIIASILLIILIILKIRHLI